MASLEAILEMFDTPKVTDYLSLDVEGAEDYIMKDFPLDKYQFLCLTVERPKGVLKALLDKHGYKHVLEVSGSIPICMRVDPWFLVHFSFPYE
jgi:hypothetical protein